MTAEAPLAVAPLAAALWRACWQGAAFIAAVWAVSRLLTRLPAAARQWLWWLACLRLIVGLLWLAPFELRLLPPAPTDSAISRAPLERTSNTLETRPASADAIPATEGTSPSRRRYRPMSLLLAALVYGWLAGCLVCLGIGFHQLRSLRGLLRRARTIDEMPVAAEARRLGVALGLTVAPRLVESEAVSAPMVVGLFRPFVVLPPAFSADLAEDEIRMALSHELAHLRRRDLWWGLVPAAAQALFYFFPPAWLAGREWTTAREQACDDEALSATGALPARYGQLLLKIVSRDHRGAVAPALGATASYYTLKRRLVMMNRRSDGDMRPLRAAAGLLVALAALFLVPWRVTAQGPAPEPGKTSAATNLLPNLLANGGVEAGGQSLPAAWRKGEPVDGVQFLWDKENGYNSKASLCLRKRVNRFFPIAEWRQSFPHKGTETRLKVGAWVKAERAAKAVLDVQFRSANDELLSHQWAAIIGAKETGDPPADHDWRRYEGTVDIPDGTTQITVAPQIYGPGAVWFDDITAAYAAKEVAAVTGAVDVKLDNPGFESGGDLPSGWQAGSLPPDARPEVATFRDTAVAYKGKASLCFQKSVQSFFPVALLSQKIPYDHRARRLKVHVWVKARQAHKATIAVMMQKAEGEGKIAWGAYVGAERPGDPPANHDWKEYSSIVEIPRGTDDIVLAFEMYGPGTVWFDELTVQYVD